MVRLDCISTNLHISSVLHWQKRSFCSSSIPLMILLMVISNSLWILMGFQAFINNIYNLKFTIYHYTYLPIIYLGYLVFWLWWSWEAHTPHCEPGYCKPESCAVFVQSFRGALMQMFFLRYGSNILRGL